MRALFLAGTCAVVLWVGACSDDDETNPVGKAGTAGSTGKGGAGGRLGSGGSSGKGGSSGTSGSAGKGGGSGGMDGAGGTSGTSGSAGTSGATGAAGADGSVGTGGTAGTAGTAGASGSAGTAGNAGAAGSAGSSGTAGSAGSSGTAGSAGSSGTAGSAGSSGTAGSAGAAGASDASADACPRKFTCDDIDPATSGYSPTQYVLTLGLKSGRTRPSGGEIRIPVGDCSSPQILYAGLEMRPTSMRADFTEAGAPTEIIPCDSAELTLNDSCNGSYTVAVDISYMGPDGGTFRLSCPSLDGGRDASRD